MVMLRAGRWIAALALTLGGSHFALSEDVESPKQYREKPPEAQDLRYGTALFEFYQGNYFDALTELKVGEKRGDIPYHANHARLMEGGISLAYNMDKTAQKIFDALLSQHLPPEEQAQAWFYLAKLQFQRGDFDNARYALNQVDGEKVGDDIHDEFWYLKARSSLIENQLRDADEQIAQVKEDWPFQAYYQINRGLHIASQAGDTTEDTTTLDNLALAINPVNEEAKHLKHRAYLTSGLILLKEGRYGQAVDRFKQVDYRSTSSEEALLAWGWAALKARDYRAALTPFTYLTGFYYSDSNIAESFLMVGQIYQELEAPNQAITAYKKAIKYYEAENDRISAMLVRIEKAPLKSLYELKTEGSDNWFGAADSLPNNPNTPYLRPLFQQQAFQHLLKGWQDTNKLEANLTRAIKREAALDYVLEAQQAAFDKAVSQNTLKGLTETFAELQQQHSQLIEKVAEAKRSGTGIELMDADEKERWLSLADTQKNAENLKKHGKAKDRHFDKLAFYQGLMIWQAAESYLERIWQMEKQQRELDALVEETQSAVERVAAIRNESHRAETHSTLQTLAEDSEAALVKVRTLNARYETRIKQLTRERLIKQQERIDQYHLEAQLAIAKIHDDAILQPYQQ